MSIDRIKTVYCNTMMGHKDILKSGLEYDVIYARKLYCYLQNIPGLSKWTKNAINRRSRRAAKLGLRDDRRDK